MKTQFCDLRAEQRDLESATVIDILPTIGITPDASWTNATFAGVLCESLNTEDLSSIAIEAASDDSPFFLLPDCLYANASSITSFSASHIIIMGGDTVNTQDPLSRLPSGLINLELKNVILVHPTSGTSTQSSTYIPKWTQFTASHSSLKRLVITETGIAGNLPSVIPAGVSHFDLSRNALNGSISSSLFANSSVNASNFILNLSHNQLSGSIPENFLSEFSASVSSLEIDLSSNGLSGSIPSTLFQVEALRDLVMVNFELAHNNLEGSIAADWLSHELGNIVSLSLNVSSNRLNGTIDPSLFSELESLVDLSLDASKNRLSGPIPSFWSSMNSTALASVNFDFSHNEITDTIGTALVPPSTSDGPQFVTWDLSSNSISGPLPSALMGSSPSDLISIKLFLQNNSISGALPSGLFSTADLTSLSTVFLSLASNTLAGTIPSDFLSGVPDSLKVLSLDLAENSLSGSIPPSFLEPYTSIPRISLQLNLTRCKLSGSLPEDLIGVITTGAAFYFESNAFSGAYDFYELILNASANGFEWMDFYASDNDLNGQIHIPAVSRNYLLNLGLSRNDFNNLTVDDASTVLVSLDVSENAALTGIVPQILFDGASQLLVFNASNTALSGGFPLLSETVLAPLQSLDLRGTDVDFCNGSRSLWAASELITCDLKDTNAGSCASSYPSVCQVSEVSPTTTPNPIVGENPIPTSGTSDRFNIEENFYLSLLGSIIVYAALHIFI